MSELINIRDDRATIRWKLLTSASALALTVSSISMARAEDADRPQLWIELGGQLESMNDPQQALSPPFLASITQPNLLSALNVQRPQTYAMDGEGKISFEPDGSDWVFSASVRYGRSNGSRHIQHATPNAKIPLNITLPPPLRTAFHITHLKYGSYYPTHRLRYTEGLEKRSERHAVLDFQVGKDVGLGLFGSQGSSVLSAGVRIAQFRSGENVTLRGQPDLQYPTAPIIGSLFAVQPAWNAFRSAAIHFHGDAAMEENQRGFRGLGPSLSWNASAPFAGNPESGEITLDWGANAAILFGRQRARVHHQTTVKSYYYNQWINGGGGGCAPGPVPCEHLGYFQNKTLHATHVYNHAEYSYPTARHTNAASFNRMRSVTVPNFGAFAGISYRYANAKLSFGYRADFFFGAMDGGIDTAKKENRGFYGPFVNMSIGVGN